ncbi:MAG: GNAT family N-acetyltransferase [Alphaproteobacteria bacterium]|nr:GNAT family N-acetyltransferase [Alphaproteobacteria bacterium]
MLRDANADDAAALAALSRETFLATFGHLYRDEDRDAYIAQSFSPSIQAAEIADPKTRHRLAERDGALIGFAKFGAYKLPAAIAEASARELHRLYVVEDAKGTGVADALMRWAIDQAVADGAAAMYLGVYQDNHRAQRFYARYGFERFGEYVFEVGAARDAEFILRLSLPRAQNGRQNSR